MRKLKLFLLISIISATGIFFSSQVKADTNCQWRSYNTPINGNVSGGCLNGETQTALNIENSKCVLTKPSPSFLDRVGGTSNANYICCCVNATDPKMPKFIMPTFEVNIPTVQLSSSTCLPGENGTYQCDIPWIGEYINGIYKYGINIAGILAAIVLMAGGLLWLISGGDASKITQAKNLIIGSITGLVILMCSYILLTQINPDLVKMTPISIGTINKDLALENTDVANVTDISDVAFQKACTASKNGDLSLCQALVGKTPQGVNLTSVGGVPVDAGVAAKFEQAMQCVRDKNNKKDLFAIAYGFRSVQEQLNLYAKYGSARAAHPCCSNHGTGLAIDLRRLDGVQLKDWWWAYNASSGLTTCMNNAGLYDNLITNNGGKGEQWHWSPSGY